MDTEKFTHSDLLEIVAEAIRQARRSYVKPLDLSSAIIKDESYIELDIDTANGMRKFNLELTEVLNENTSSGYVEYVSDVSEK